MYCTDLNSFEAYDQEKKDVQLIILSIQQASYMLPGPLSCL